MHQDETLLEQLLREVRELRAHMNEGPSLPAVLTRKRAARELSISARKLRDMEKSGDVLTCEIGDSTMIPRSEIERLATPTRVPKKSRTPSAAPARGGAAATREAAALRKALRTG